ncbi:unnamed protein product [Cuscuta campestris]|uniref:Uncharacterized protein n=1 Tax=Cuscuta campestris TaxID=132261 RepID=A0A484LU36_9ASTE|nr:unnamed protein product [Cuscuta campestris]
MAGCDSQKQLLTLIRDFASEKSQGERRIANLKNRIGELLSEIDAAHANLEEAKQVKESIEQELKGNEVELGMSGASIQTLEIRIASTQEEISAIGSSLNTLKDEESTSREDFIKRMVELNTEIRKFYEAIGSAFSKRKSNSDSDKPNELAKRNLEDKLAHLVSQITMEEEDYQTMKNVQKQVEEEQSIVARRAKLMEAVMKESIKRQELNKYPPSLSLYLSHIHVYNYCKIIGSSI